MRTLTTGSGTGSSGPRGERRRRRLAGGVLLVGVAAVMAAALIPSDPLEAGRRAKRATIRARGGTFESFPGAVLQSGLSDCGPAALATLLRTLGGDPPTLDSIAALAGTGARGTSFAGLARAARTLGLESELVRVDPAAKDRLESPLIAWVEEGHFVTVVPDSSGSVLVLDPQVGPYRIGLEALFRFWSGEALIPRPAHAHVAPAAHSQSEGGER